MAETLASPKVAESVESADFGSGVRVFRRFTSAFHLPVKPQRYARGKFEHL